MSENSSLKIFSPNPINQYQLKMGHILQKGSWQSLLWISLLLQKLPCSTIIQQLYVIMCNHNWKFILKGKKFWLLLSEDTIMCYEMLCKFSNATEMYKVFCCYSSTLICSDFCCFFWLLIWILSKINIGAKVLENSIWVK